MPVGINCQWEQNVLASLLNVGSMYCCGRVKTMEVHLDLHHVKMDLLFTLQRVPDTARLVMQENSYLWRTSLYLAASASAEFFADIFLCPMEAVKVRIQTSPGWAGTLREGVPKLMGEEGMMGYVNYIY